MQKKKLFMDVKYTIRVFFYLFALSDMRCGVRVTVHSVKQVYMSYFTNLLEVLGIQSMSRRSFRSLDVDVNGQGAFA